MSERSRLLGLEDLDEMVRVEQEAWIPLAQASRELIETRVRLGHQIMGWEIDRRLVGMVSWCYKKINVADLAVIPKPDEKLSWFEDFVNFSKGKSVLENANSAFIYSTGVSHKQRGSGIGTRLMQDVLEEIKRNGIKHVLLDGRCPSYNGGSEYPQEQVKQVPEFKRAIDECNRTGELPSVEDMKLDFTLRFYDKLGFKPFKLLPHFYENDIPTGGNRLIVYQEL
tara:strand:- start:146 stop:820 length:675 start_codon:yes stop_codon:yes gene_type:complete